jgi:two-component system, OmpR family, phosphate regulon sensor histidine kinase PhoR
MALRLHSRLVALNVAALGVMTLLLAYFLGSNLKTTFESEIESQLYRSATLAKAYVKALPPTGDKQDIASTIGKLLAVRVTIIAPDGRVLGDSDLTSAGLQGMENHANRPEFIQARQSGRGTSIRQSATLGVPFIYVATTLEDGPVLRLAMPLASVETLMSGLRRQLTVSMGIGVALSLLFGYMVYGVVSRPLRRMADASHQLAYGDLNTVIPVMGDRDLATVGSSLNAMAKSLRRKMEELESDKYRTEAIIAAMSAGVTVFDHNARVILANRSMQTLLDLHGDTSGKIPMELVRDPAIESAIRQALAGLDPPSIDLTTRGNRVLLAKAAAVRSISGAVELVVMVFHDLTEIRRTEKMRKDFVANVSHEFKTPLTSIRGFAETLLNAEPEDPAVRHEFLEAIERNSALLQALVDDLLVLASLERELPVQKESLNLQALLTEQLRSRQHALAEKQIRVELDCPQIEILVDRSRLMRAVSNLIDNAIHYNRQGGEIRISVSPAQNGTRIDILDTGVGIPPGDLVRVFERFYRVEKSRTREHGGTGLGLAIAKHAIESQGGILSVTSRVGVGSTFTILLSLG